MPDLRLLPMPARLPAAARVQRLPGGDTPDWSEWLARYGVLVGFLLITVVLSRSGVARPFFIAGCAGLGYLAWRRGVAAHLELVIILFTLAPLLRRMTDYHVGWDPSGVMLVGPLLALLVPCSELYSLLIEQGRARGVRLQPFLIYGGCIVYAWAISSLKGQVVPSSTAAVRLAAPLLYGIWLVARREPRAALTGATRAFSIILPLVGLYGIMQWLNPSEWDRYWMLMAPIDSIGLPLPKQVRVFGPLNSPASYAMFITCGLLLVMNARRGLLTLLIAAPACLGLLLSQFRTAWLGLIIGLVFFFVLPSTRRRSGLFVLFMVAAVTVTATATPFADVVTHRLETLQSSPTEDGSGSARLEQGDYLYAHLEDFVIGYGFIPQSSNGKLERNLSVVDGAIVISIIDMGLIVGALSLVALCWAGLAAIRQSWAVREPLFVAAGGIVAAQLIDTPLTSVTTGELGFLTWTFIAILISLGRKETRLIL